MLLITSSLISPFCCYHLFPQHPKRVFLPNVQEFSDSDFISREPPAKKLKMVPWCSRSHGTDGRWRSYLVGTDILLNVYIYIQYKYTHCDTISCTYLYYRHRYKYMCIIMHNIYIYIYLFSNFAEMNIFLYGGRYNTCMWPVMTGPPEQRPRHLKLWQGRIDPCLWNQGNVWWLVGKPCFGRLMQYGYGSIPINTIFRGMNIHLPAILMFTRGTRFWHTAI